jgi:hypothetical protein
MTLFGRVRFFFLSTAIAFSLLFAYLCSYVQGEGEFRLFASYAAFGVLLIVGWLLLERQLKKADLKRVALLLASLPLGVVLGLSFNSIFDACLGWIYQENLSLVRVYVHSASVLTGCFITLTLAARAASEFFPSAQEKMAPSLNISTNTVKPQLPTGELLKIKIQRLGKEPLQGVGYLEDGTMVVVNGGGKFLGEEIDVAFLSVKQTSAGRLIFCNTLEAAPYRDSKEGSVREQSTGSIAPPQYTTPLRTKSAL